MEINFLSYVQMIMLFLKQEETNNCLPHRFHIVNVSSIAGHLTSARNSDYSASKFALTGFADSLRQELGWNSAVSLTNFYPYYINTGLFEGFKPKLRFFLPTLDADAVAKQMYDDIMAEKQEVYISAIIYWFKMIHLMLPTTLRNFVSHVLVGEGMEHFVGRQLKLE